MNLSFPHFCSELCWIYSWSSSVSPNSLSTLSSLFSYFKIPINYWTSSILQPHIFPFNMSIISCVCSFFSFLIFRQYLGLIPDSVFKDLPISVWGFLMRCGKWNLDGSCARQTSYPLHNPCDTNMSVPFLSHLWTFSSLGGHPSSASEITSNNLFHTTWYQDSTWGPLYTRLVLQPFELFPLPLNCFLE